MLKMLNLGFKRFELSKTLLVSDQRNKSNIMRFTTYLSLHLQTQNRVYVTWNSTGSKKRAGELREVCGVYIHRCRDCVKYILIYRTKKTVQSKEMSLKI